MANNLKKRIEIPEEILRELIACAHRFLALEQGGVENWEWCGDSLDNYLNQENNNYESYAELAEDFLKLHTTYELTEE